MDLEIQYLVRLHSLETVHCIQGLRSTGIGSLDWSLRSSTGRQNKTPWRLPWRSERPRPRSKRCRQRFV